VNTLVCPEVAIPLKDAPTRSDIGGVNHLRALLLSTSAILACAFAGIGALPAGVSAAQSPDADTTGSASPIARAATHSRGSGRRRSHSACQASRAKRKGKGKGKGKKGHMTCRSRGTHAHNTQTTHNAKTSEAASGTVATSTSHAARNHPVKHAHSGRHEGVGSRRRDAQTGSASPEGGQSIASVLATPCENTELTPEPGNIETIDAATLCLVNQERARNNELPLQPNAQLEQAAQGHSEEMVEDDYFAHVAPSGLTPVGRIEETGYLPNHQVGYTLGENIAWGTLGLSTPAAIVAAWIASPEHLANILFSPYRDTAIGVAPEAPASLAVGQPGAVYSQEFGVITG
jgi:uncharacterized protein YkwD